MPYVLIRHKVADYSKWKRAVQAKADMRRTSGEKSFHVYRDSRNPKDLTVICEWDSSAKMQKFMKSAELRRAMQEAGVKSKPMLQFFGKVEELSVA